MDFGEKLHKLEMLEMDFLKKMGVDTAFVYSDVENHVDKFYAEAIDGFTTLEDLGTSYNEYEETLGNLERLTDKVDCAINTLFRMKKLIETMRKSPMKETLLAYLNDVFEDLEN